MYVPSQQSRVRNLLFCNMRFTKEQVRQINALHHKKGRNEQQLFLAEGSKIVSELTGSNFFIEHIFSEDHSYQVTTGSSPVTLLEKGQLQRVTALDTAPSILALVRYPPVQRVPDSSGWSLVLDEVQNPGNLGAIIRIADWYGIPEIVCSPSSADCFSPKVVQASMGSLLRVQVTYTHLAEWLKKQERKIYAAMLQGTDVKSLPSASSGILIIGNEGKGISAGLLSFVSECVTIPGKGEAESLNAAVSAGILIDRLTRL